MSELTRFNYESFKEEPLPGTADWVEVAALDDGRGGYEWTEFKAFYSPTARRYFWHGDGGCSCNSWADGIAGVADFEVGDRGALLRAWEAFAKDNEYSITVSTYMDGAAEIRKFSESDHV